jgi:hypothetical protein
VVRLKGVRLRDLEDEDSDFDPEITFSIEELSSSDYVDSAQSERGYYLVQYSYHAHHHGIDQRWDQEVRRRTWAKTRFRSRAGSGRRRRGCCCWRAAAVDRSVGGDMVTAPFAQR